MSSWFLMECSCVFLVLNGVQLFKNQEDTAVLTHSTHCGFVLTMGPSPRSR